MVWKSCYGVNHVSYWIYIYEVQKRITNDWLNKQSGGTTSNSAPTTQLAQEKENDICGCPVFQNTQLLHSTCNLRKQNPLLQIADARKHEHYLPSMSRNVDDVDAQSSNTVDIDAQILASQECFNELAIPSNADRLQLRVFKVIWPSSLITMMLQTGHSNEQSTVESRYTEVVGSPR